MKVYIDSSCLNRIFDDQSQPRIFFESIAMGIVFILIDNQEIEFVSSDALNYEMEKNPFLDRKEFVRFYLEKAKTNLELNESILKRSIDIEKMKIKGIDAIHVSLSELNSIDYFLTVDDGILKNYSGSLKILNPVNFISQITTGEIKL
ncbi:MAG: hypothetical protein SFU98_10050 [Leptospiraceae bacterium]|nr:hypothetical protein [Leptospiraceae bacterium]